MITEQLKQAAKAATENAAIDNQTRTAILTETAQLLKAETHRIIEANAIDLAKMDSKNPKYDRLKLDEARIEGIADDMLKVATLPSPLGKTLNQQTRPNGLCIRKVSVPFGVIGIIYEARPNVTADVFSLCFKSGNVCILKGGHEAEESNKIITELIHSVLKKHHINPAVCTLLPNDREATNELLKATETVDLIIPRGSSALINYVRQNALVPVIETGAGICHTYFDKEGDKEKGAAIVNNAKTRRVSVCNALDCLIIHKERLADLPYICKPTIQSNVIIYADEAAYEALKGKHPDELLRKATAENFGTEFLDYKMAVKSVDTIDEALEHIAQYGSKHSECIVSESDKAIQKFQQSVDAACVYANASTAFTDGGQFGFGAEIGISTQKLHARGPMALPELTTYKYLITGNGQTRK